MPTTVKLMSRVRKDQGKGAARRLRRGNRIPGVLYGRGADPVLLDVDEHEFVKMVSDHSTSNLIVDLQMGDGPDVVKTLIREVQVDPVSGAVLHVDLNQISLTEKIDVEVPIEISGTPVGVKNSGGILQHSIRNLLLRCLPHQIPDKIRLDATHLEIGDSIKVNDLDLPDVEILADPENTLANVIPPAKVVEPAAEEVAAAAVEEGAEPEVVGKKEEEEGAGASEEKKSD